MALTEPILTKRIPCWPFADPAGRALVLYDRFVETGGYAALRKAIDMPPGEVIDLVKSSDT